MDLHTIGVVGAGVVGTGRVLTGLYFLAQPREGATAWVGESSAGTRCLVGSVGGRDVAIGAGVLWALATDSSATPWVLASVASDLADAGFAASTLDRDHRKRAVVAAGGFAALGLATAALLAGSAILRR